DVFEGLSAMDVLTDPARRSEFISQVRSEIEAERDRVEQPVVARVVAKPSAGPRRDLPVPVPPFWGPRRVLADLGIVWQHLDLNTLYRHHWGGHRAKGPEYERIVSEIFEPQLAALQASALEDGWLDALIVSGYFPVQSKGNQLIVFDPADPSRSEERRV